MTIDSTGKAHKPSGSPDGGQFAATTKTEANVALPAIRPGRPSDTTESAAQDAMAARHREYTSLSHDIDNAAKAVFPEGSEVVLFRSYDDDEFSLHQVRDPEGEILWDSEEHHTGEDAGTGINQLLPDGYEPGAYFTEGDHMDGYVASFTVGSTKAADIPGRFDHVDWSDMSITEKSQLFFKLYNELGAVSFVPDKTEINYRLTEEAENYPEGAIEKLDTKYGSRDAALEALSATAAWYELDEQMNEASTHLVGPAVQKAVAELGVTE